MLFTKKGKELKRERTEKHWDEDGKCEWLTYSQHIYLDIYMGQNLCGTLIGPHGRTLALVSLDQANAMWAPTAKPRMCAKQSSLGIGHHSGSKGLRFRWGSAVSDILSASTQNDPSTTRE
ncbi:hypothetical protein O181_018336 [Austropuccinia psidii MF-1]|uniref:Uncharacterized protein n=1 Tax=Austropuccinia psidii MF-1 TaxID=1389203 RepID=A0A9Q3C546_9BASI|nr:hypothetical protein [Austropuccinia psidii MF-1]